jgi:hypothetical protein
MSIKHKPLPAGIVDDPNYAVSKDEYEDEHIFDMDGINISHADLDDLDYASAGHTGFQPALGFTPENVANLRTSFQAIPDDTHYISEKLAKDSLDSKSATSHNHNLADLSEKNYNSLTDKPIDGAVPQYLNPASPTNLTSNSYLMFGLGSIIHIIPLKSGKVRFTIGFYPSGVGTNGLNNYKVAYGSGAAPINGAAATGTVGGGTHQGGAAISLSSTTAMIIRNIIVTGLTLNTAYWFDVQGAKYSTNTSLGMSNIEATLEELPY